jgi:predicted nucleotidyltransferase
MQRMNSEARESLLDTAARIVADALPDAWAIYVFGSAARGDDTPESDLDLAVLLPPGSSIPDKLGLITDVAVAIGRDVEIVDLRRANLDLVHALLNEGRQLLVRREEETLVWEAERMTDYALFNPRRADIVEQYMRGPLGGRR